MKLGWIGAMTIGGLIALQPLAQAQEKKQDNPANPATPAAPAATPAAPGAPPTLSPALKARQIDAQVNSWAKMYGLTEEQNRPVLIDEPQGGEVLDEFAVHRWLELEVEVGEPSAVREPGVTQPGGESSVPIGGGLLGDESGEELDVGPVVGAGLLR